MKTPSLIYFPSKEDNFIENIKQFGVDFKQNLVLTIVPEIDDST